jgi:single-stranded DNA-binding protein
LLVPSMKLPVLNQATFAGRLAADPVALGDVAGVGATFVVAVTTAPQKRGDPVQVPCVAWGSIAQTMLRKLRRHAAVLVTGGLSTAGQARRLHVRVTAIQFLDDDPLI